MAKVPNIDCKDFKLGKVLGHGGYGRVYEGKWKDRRVAVKEIREGDKSFDIEVEQLSRVKDSNIIELFATAANEEFKYIIMEYADGGSLHNFLHSEFKPFYTESQGLNWANQCARGVSYLHKMQKPMLHRDLKPQNMLLTKNYSLLKICDFGTVAELKSSMTSERGTNMYMAPEVFGGRKYNEKCDVYSWAILLWEILSREEPFKDVEAKNVVPFLASQGKRPADTISCPPAIKRLMESCWDKNPDKRPTMETIVAVVSLHVSIFHSPSEKDVRKHFPTIPSDNCYNFENLERIRWNSKTIVHLGKMAHKKVTIMMFPTPYGSKGYIWLQQHLPLKHKNIISILGIKGSVPKAAILEYTDLIPLDLFLHGDVKLEYSRAHALSWAHQCSEGMKYLQSIKPKPFIRLALNPTNLLLTQGATQLKIGNFEIFEWTDLSFRNIAYEAPEVCEKNIAIKESDVYSWAIVLWEMLTRQKPFGNIPVHQVSSHIIDGERPAIVEDWPESIKKLMENCWDRNWRERPTMENVASEMATFVGAPLKAIVSANDLQRIHQLMPWDANVEEFNKLSPSNPRVPEAHSCNDNLCQAMDICIDTHLFFSGS